MDGNDKYVGRILDNRYEILELIGAGGMALVYKARCHRLNRMVAIKILKEDLAGDQEFQRRFYTESQAVAMLSHPNIVSVYDVSRSGNTEYIVMELIEGITLKQYINRKGLLNWKETLHFSTQITKALGHAHSRGIIHRDIKPHNIIILKDGSVKVADFGIARLLTVDNTLTQEALGSVHYISPEQAKGGQVDTRSDIYSLGVVMYEMLTSRLPFVGDSAVSVAIQHISAIPLRPREINPDIPIGLEDITMHAMEPDLNMRFATADEMLYSLEEFRKNPAIMFRYAKTALNAANPEMYNGYETGAAHREQPKHPHPHPGARAGNPAPQQRQAPPQQHQYQQQAHQQQHQQQPPPQQQHPQPPPQRTLRKPEMSSDEYRVAKTRASNTATLVGLFGTLIFILILVVFIINIVGPWFGLRSNEPVLIPDFYNQRYSDIITDDQYTETFQFAVTREEYRNDVEIGRVFWQNPTADREVTPGDSKISISLGVSLGNQPPTEMPDLRGLHSTDARNQLNRLRLALDISSEVVESDTVEAGYIVETRPPHSESLSEGDAVMLIISGGPDPRFEIVPDMVGRSIEDLEELFAELDITADIRLIENQLEAGTVLYIQQVNERIAVPATLIVNVSLGPPERYVTVPNLVWNQISVVLEAFEPLELSADIEYIEDWSLEGTVLFIEYAGQEIPVPATIIVHVSLGPPEPPPDDSALTEDPPTIGGGDDDGPAVYP